MNEASVVRRTQWLWWVAVVMLGVGLAVDIVNGQPLRLATSASLFLGSLLSALLPLPRSQRMGMVIFGCFALGVSLMIFRAVTGNL